MMAQQQQLGKSLVCILSWHMQKIYSTPTNPTIGNNNKNCDVCYV
jgi:hypothetical protein